MCMHPSKELGRACCEAMCKLTDDWTFFMSVHQVGRACNAPSHLQLHAVTLAQPEMPSGCQGPCLSTSMLYITLNPNARRLHNRVQLAA